MSILFGSDVDIQLANTSFNCNTTSSMSVALFTATDKGTYHFTGTLTATTQNSSFGFGFLINGTYKDLRTTDYTTGPLDVNLDFTADVGDIITLSASGIGTGSNLAVTEDVKEPREIYVGEGNQINDYSAMRGPCPEGFHVPSRNEWENVTGILFTTLGLSSGDSTTVNVYLKMPNAGSRSGGTVSGRNTAGYYWTCSSSSSFVFWVRSFKSGQPSSGTVIQELRAKTTAVSIRGFKDVPVVPDNTWTVLYNGSSIAAGAGIFHSASLGLISISGDGQTWITMSDKNLGATTVRNNGDTLTAANSGGHFQWGNNYMFPFDGTVETSSTQIDTSAYGPGNYYSSNIFISGTSNNDWSSPSNSNLRGGVTGVQQKHIGNVIEVYVGTTKVRPTWKPGANTIAYFPFEDDQLDKVGGYTLTGNGVKDTIGYTFTVSTDINNISGINYWGVWYKLNSIDVYHNCSIIMNTNLGYCGYNAGQTETRYRGKIAVNDSSWNIIGETAGMSIGQRHYLAFSNINGELLVCKDGVVSVLTNQTPYNFGDNKLFLNYCSSSGSNNATYSQLIIESVGRTAQGMEDYYNLTKGKYEQQQSGGSGQGENNGGSR